MVKWFLTAAIATCILVNICEAANPGITVSARQRYPWNGLVDFTFTISGTAGTQYDTSFSANDILGGTNITMATVSKENGSSANVSSEWLLPGSYNWIWNADADLPDGWESDRVTITGNLNIFNYSVKFNANGGSGSMANESFTYGTAKALTANSFTRAGYIFQGWATSANGAKVYSNSESVNNLTTSPNAVVNLYAVWKQASYMVIDLSAGSSASSYPVSYLETVPSGGWTDVYKRTKLVLRRVAKGTNSAGGAMENDMWVGIFEVTGQQYIQVCGDFSETLGGGTYYKPSTNPTSAVGFISFNRANNFLNVLRTRSSISMRLPTILEWQYACRAGTTTDYNNGKSATEANMNQVGWYSGNISNSSSRPAIVGQKTPNAWGLYDMHGNVSEKTSDYYYNPGAGGTYHCGGDYDSSYLYCTSSSKGGVISDQPYTTSGLRVFAEIAN